MPNFLSNNLRLLRKNAGLDQAEMKASTGFNRSTWSNYENGISMPDIDGLRVISEFFKIGIEDLVFTDLSEKGKVIEKQADYENKQKGKVIGKVIGKENADSGRLSPLNDHDAEYGTRDTISIPITDISVAAGTGIYNHDYIDNAEVIRLPANLLKRGSTYLTVRIKGASMAPTLQDGSFMIIRQLDKGEWSKIRDEYIYVICDNEGKGYLKRVKNRLKQQFIVLMSDNPDKATYPNFNLNINEIQSVWFAELYLTARMPNIHDQYYSRLQALEDKVDDMARGLKKSEGKLK